MENSIKKLANDFFNNGDRFYLSFNSNGAFIKDRELGGIAITHISIKNESQKRAAINRCTKLNNNINK
jgi:hypothetical protein